MVELLGMAKAARAEERSSPRQRPSRASEGKLKVSRKGLFRFEPRPVAV
jgi:hypothetical protein